MSDLRVQVMGAGTHPTETLTGRTPRRCRAAITSVLRRCGAAVILSLSPLAALAEHHGENTGRAALGHCAPAVVANDPFGVSRLQQLTQNEQEAWPLKDGSPFRRWQPVGGDPRTRATAEITEVRDVATCKAWPEEYT